MTWRQWLDVILMLAGVVGAAGGALAHRWPEAVWAAVAVVTGFRLWVRDAR